MVLWPCKPVQKDGERNHPLRGNFSFIFCKTFLGFSFDHLNQDRFLINTEGVGVEEVSCYICFLLCEEDCGAYRYLLLLLHCHPRMRVGPGNPPPQDHRCLYPVHHHHTQCRHHSKVSMHAHWRSQRNQARDLQSAALKNLIFCRCADQFTCWSSGSCLRMWCPCIGQKQPSSVCWRRAVSMNGLSLRS